MELLNGVAELRVRIRDANAASMRNMYYLFLIMRRRVRAVKPFGRPALRAPLARCASRLAPTPKTIDPAHVRLADDFATVKSSQVVPLGESATWQTKGCAERSLRAD